MDLGTRDLIEARVYKRGMRNPSTRKSDISTKTLGLRMEPISELRKIFHEFSIQIPEIQWLNCK